MPSFIVGNNPASLQSNFFRFLILSVSNQTTHKFHLVIVPFACGSVNVQSLDGRRRQTERINSDIITTNSCVLHTTLHIFLVHRIWSAKLVRIKLACVRAAERKQNVEPARKPIRSLIHRTSAAGQLSLRDTRLDHRVPKQTIDGAIKCTNEPVHQRQNRVHPLAAKLLAHFLRQQPLNLTLQRDPICLGASQRDLRETAAWNTNHFVLKVVFADIHHTNLGRHLIDQRTVAEVGIHQLHCVVHSEFINLLHKFSDDRAPIILARLLSQHKIA
mmetsp:Transcript_32281/g.52243  ORF Transcript_32281/g.52243 Transcript_32281/m.52243 type:complete len:273 (-) Transcript_32281:679-1497(-)